MNDTLRYKYAKFPKIKLQLKNTPIGTIALKYTRPVMGTFFLLSRIVVNLANNWVAQVANTRCHVVRRIG